MKQSWVQWRQVLLDDSRPTYGAKGMGLFLHSYMNDNQDIAWPSIATVCGRMNCSRSTAIKYINELEGLGWIQKEKRFSKSTIYHSLIPREILSSLESGLVQDLDPSSLESRPVPVQSLDSNIQENITSNNQDTTRGETPAESPPRKCCPYNEILNLYHTTLPELPAVVRLTDKRKRALKARWGNGMYGLDEWKSYFEDIRGSKFLMGKVDPWGGRKQFIADFDFLIRESTTVKTQEGKYH